MAAIDHRARDQPQHRAEGGPHEPNEDTLYKEEHGGCDCACIPMP